MKRAGIIELFRRRLQRDTVLLPADTDLKHAPFEIVRVSSWPYDWFVEGD